MAPLMSLLQSIFYIPIPTLVVVLFLVHKLRKYIRSLRAVSAKGKVVVITGASSGIGEELALQYAKQGAKVVISARRVDKLNNLAETCKQTASDVLVVAADVSKEADCKNLVETATQKFGAIDILILNAGLGQAFFLEATEGNTSMFKDFMEINYWGAVWTTYFALPALRKSRGRIAVISSMGGLVPFPRQTLYNSSKYALQGFFETLRTELGSSGVSVTVANPGFIKTEMTTGAGIGKDGKPLSQSVVSGKPNANALAGSGMMSAKECARQIIAAIGQRERNIIVPSWYRFFPILKFFSPELLDYFLKKKFVKKSKKD